MEPVARSCVELPMPISSAASWSFALVSALAFLKQQVAAQKPEWTRERALAALCSGSVAEQVVAAQQLEYHGPAVLAELRTRRDGSTDQELRTRIENVIGGIELQHPGGLVIVFPRGEITRNELWVWRDGEEFALTANTTMETDLALSPDGRHLLFSTTPDHHDFGVHDLHAIELASGVEVLRDRGHGGSFSPDGVQLAILRQDGLVLRGIGRDQERRLAPELGEVREVQWSPNGRFLAVVSGDEVVVLEAATGAVHARIDSTPPNTSTMASFALSDSVVVMVSGNGPYEWDLFVAAIGGGEARKRTTRAFQHGMASLAPDGRRALLLQSRMTSPRPDQDEPGVPRSGRGGGRDYAANLVELDGDQEPREVFGSANPLLRPSWSPEGRFVVFADGGGNLQLLHVHSGRTRALTKMDVGYGPSTTSFAPAVWFAQGRAVPVIRAVAPAAK
jgi:Tol biopolymer transport system component